MVDLIKLVSKKPHNPLKGVWLFVIFLMVCSFLFCSCTKDESLSQANLILKTGTLYTPNGASIPVGGKIQIGVLASGAGVPLTYIRIDRISGNDTLTQLDRGIYAGSEGLDADYSFSKDTSAVEIWRIMVMNADRDTAVKTLLVLRGSGTAYGPINSFSSIKFGMQSNITIGHFVDIHTGNVFDGTSVAGHEGEIDVIAYYYITSGLSSPTFTCPGYTAAVGYYPQLGNWLVKNNILYDYQTSDNNLVSISQFDAALNDSLLVTTFKPDKVSGNCKYGYTGKVIPFKTQEGKYGMIKVIHADEKDDGIMEIAVKIQK
jgi:hypothetical protein